MLIIIPTPLGNLKDITVRALDILSKAEIVFCEDTRPTMALLAHYGARARVERYNEHSPFAVQHALDLLRRHENCALVSDRGTPCISDPGWKLVAAALAEGIKVESLPGPSAVACALAGSGFPVSSFVFLGFLPRRKSRIEAAVRNAASLGKPVAIYESPFRVAALLEAVARVLGPQTRVVLARELTKVHEEWLRGTAQELAARLRAKPPKGEFTVVLFPSGEEPEPEQDGPDEDREA
ncbi:MAG: 16S rRNA (cytidine(1402)-2'-O)-methyltransferase [Elusimicrobia bacterium]|nr:16S rRNA (cytidine(1402)-2'-O)-methyltransferase [Elusimicrobiota bacterium]